MSPVWPFGRDRGGRRPPEPVPFTPRRTDWQLLPPIQRTTGDQWLANPADSMSSRLASWHNPSYLAPLGHAVPPDGPSGAIEPAPVRAEPKRIDLQRSAAPGPPIMFTDATPQMPDIVAPEAPHAAASEPSVQSAAPEPPRPRAAVQRSATAEEPRPLLGASDALVDAADHAIADDDWPVPDTPSATAAPTDPGAEAAAQTLPIAQTLSTAPPPPTAQRVTTPFAVQRVMDAGSAPLTGDSGIDPPVPVRPAAPAASLLAASDAPERRSLPVVPATTPAVQRAVAATEPPASPSAPSPGAPPEPVAEPEIAPLVGGPGTAVRGFSDPGLGGPIEPVVQTAPSEPLGSQAAADPPASSEPTPTTPLIARPLQRATEPARSPLGLGSPQSGPMTARPSSAVQRGDMSATAHTTVDLPTAPPVTLLQRTAGPVPPSPPRPVSRPATPPVIVSRTAAPEGTAAPVAVRTIEHPAPAYRPPEPTATVPLLGERTWQSTPAEPDTQPANAPVAEAPAATPVSVPDGPAVQRSTWSHMPPPVRHAAAAAEPPRMPPPAPTGPVAAAPVAVPPAPAPAPTLPQAVPVQRLSASADPPEPRSDSAETGVQRVSVDRPEPHVVVQTEEAPAAPAAPEAAPVETAGADPGALLAVLYEPLMRRLRADLRVDRERRGRLTDL